MPFLNTFTFDALISVGRIANPTYITRMAIQESIDNVLGIGHTSGADALARVHRFIDVLSDILLNIQAGK